MKGFIRTKRIHGKPRNYLVQSYRDKSRDHPRQRVFYLGQQTTVQGRIVELQKNLRTLRRQLKNAEKELCRYEAQADEVAHILQPWAGSMRQQRAESVERARGTVNQYLQVTIPRAKGILDRLKAAL